MIELAERNTSVEETLLFNDNKNKLRQALEVAVTYHSHFLPFHIRVAAHMLAQSNQRLDLMNNCGPNPEYLHSELRSFLDLEQNLLEASGRQLIDRSDIATLIIEWEKLNPEKKAYDPVNRGIGVTPAI